MRKLRFVSMLLMAVAFVATGCAKKELIEQKDQQIADLDAQVQKLGGEIDELESELQKQRELNDELQKSLSDLQNKHEVWLQERKGLMHITLDGAANFPTAQADLTEEAKRAIDRLGGVLQNYPDRWVLIEGHADERPIAKSFRWKYPSNWELSTARANAVLHYLLRNFDLDPSRVKAVGLGEYHPVAGGSSPDAWAKNRCVVITVGNKLDVEKQMASHGN